MAQRNTSLGMEASSTAIPLSATTATFQSHLPVLLIHNFGAGRPPANTPIYADFQVYEPDTNGVTRLTGPPALATRSTIRARGSSTEGYPKVSLRVEFQDEFGEYPAGTWLRNPRWSRHAPFTGPDGALIYVKTGHLGAELLQPGDAGSGG